MAIIERLIGNLSLLASPNLLLGANAKRSVLKLRYWEGGAKIMQSQDINEFGYCFVPNAFDQPEIVQMRKNVLDNLHFMSNTRPTKTAYHIAGFHRFPELEPLHRKISGNDGQ